MKIKEEETKLSNEEAKSYDTLIEEKRTPLYKEFLVSKKISNILTFVVLACAIAGMYLVTSTLAWLGWVILGVGLVSMIVFYFLSKKKFETNTKNYLAFVNETLNNQTFSNKNFSDIVVTEDKLEANDFDGNGVYSDVIRVASRNISNGKYAGTAFKFAEAAVFKKPVDKKHAAVASFVGKYFEAENSLKFAGNIVINISREEPVDVPTALEGRAKLYSATGIAVYGDEGQDFRAIIGEEFFGRVKKLAVERHLLNLAISIFEGRTLVFMSYDDDVIALPFDKPFNAEAFDTFVEDFKNVFDVINTIGK